MGRLVGVFCRYSRPTWFNVDVNNARVCLSLLASCAFVFSFKRMGYLTYNILIIEVVAYKDWNTIRVLNIVILNLLPLS